MMNDFSDGAENAPRIAKIILKKCSKNLERSNENKYETEFRKYINYVTMNILTKPTNICIVKLRSNHSTKNKTVDSDLNVYSFFLNGKHSIFIRKGWTPTLFAMNALN